MGTRGGRGFLARSHAPVLLLKQASRRAFSPMNRQHRPAAREEASQPPPRASRPPCFAPRPSPSIPPPPTRGPFWHARVGSWGVASGQLDGARGPTATVPSDATRGDGRRSGVCRGALVGDRTCRHRFGGTCRASRARHHLETRASLQSSAPWPAHRTTNKGPPRAPRVPSATATIAATIAATAAAPPARAASAPRGSVGDGTIEAAPRRSATRERTHASAEVQRPRT